MSTDVFTETFSALGTTATLVVTERAALPRGREVLEEVLADIDRSCSRFRGDSDLTRVNDAGGDPVTVGPTLIEAIEVALRAARLTDGEVDPTIGNALRLLGYDRDFATVAATGGPLSYVVERVPGWWTVDVDHAASTVRVPDGVLLDLGHRQGARRRPGRGPDRRRPRVWRSRQSRRRHRRSRSGPQRGLGGPRD